MISFINILTTFNIAIVEGFQTLLIYFVKILLLFSLNSDDCKLNKIIIIFIINKTQKLFNMTGINSVHKLTCR